jgi:hypothetical protein
VKLNWNFMLFAFLTAIALSGVGCSGVNTGASVSPAEFFVPGLLKADPPKASPLVLPAETYKQFAVAR